MGKCEGRISAERVLRKGKEPHAPLFSIRVRREERVKKRPPSLCSFLLYRNNRREVRPAHRYLFESSVFDVELFGIHKIKQLSILLPAREDKCRY